MIAIVLSVVAGNRKMAFFDAAVDRAKEIKGI